MIATTSSKLAYLLFPCVCSRDTSELLMPLTSKEVTDLLEKMAWAGKLSDRRHGPSEIVFRNSNTVRWEAPAAPFVRRRPSPPVAVAAHPSVATVFLPAAPSGYDIGLHIAESMVFLTGNRDGRPFESIEVYWSDVMRCRLATAQRRMVPTVFRQLAEIDPWSAVEILEDELVLYGSPQVVREITPFLKLDDLLPILEWPDDEVRERAIMAMGRMRSGA